MMKAAAFGQQLNFFWQPTIKKIPKWYLYELIHYLCLRYRLIRGDRRCNITSKGSCVKMRIDYQKAMSKGAKRRISCILVCVSEILHSVQDDKMKVDFYFETASLRIFSRTYQEGKVSLNYAF